MTRENGRIAVWVRFPLFGTVAGEKPVSDLRSPPPGPEGPAVAYSPMSQPKVTAEAGSAAPVAAPTVTETVAVAPDTPAAKPAASAEQNEAKAKSIMGMAKTYLSAGMRDKAIAKLNDLIARYPDTATAAEAKAMLVAMK